MDNLALSKPLTEEPIVKSLSILFTKLSIASLATVAVSTPILCYLEGKSVQKSTRAVYHHPDAAINYYLPQQLYDRKEKPFHIVWGVPIRKTYWMSSTNSMLAVTSNITSGTIQAVEKASEKTAETIEKWVSPVLSVIPLGSADEGTGIIIIIIIIIVIY